MNKFNYDNLGGQPIDLDHFDKLQKAWNEPAKAMAGLIGNKVIVSGCDIVAGQMTDGFICYNGEILKFVSGSLSSHLVVVETPTAVIFDDTNSHEVEFERYLTFGISGDFLFTQLQHAPVFYTGDIKEKHMQHSELATSFDIDGYGLGRHRGWRILQFAVPTSAGKVFVNYDSSNPLFDTLGATGGAETHKLLPNEQGNIEFRTKRSNAGTGTTNSPTEGIEINGAYANSSGLPAGTFGAMETVELKDTADSFSILNPYFVILKLYKL